MELSISIKSLYDRARRHRLRIAGAVATVAVLVSVLLWAPWSTAGEPGPSSATPSSSANGSGPSGEPLRGLGFSPFRDCQSPELQRFPTADQMREDVDIIRGMGNAVRTYSALNGAAAVVEHAHKANLRISAGAWLGPEKTDEQRQANRREIDALVELARTYPLESVIVGNEVLLRGDLPPQRLVDYIREVKTRVTVPVTTAEIASVATRQENRPVIDAVDFLMAHIYPYWDGVDIDGAAWYVAGVYQQTAKTIGKRVVIGETGWPSAGPTRQQAIPNVANAGRFLAEWVAVAAHEKIDYYYFAAFDEPWKQEEGVGAHWGIRDQARQPKYPVTSLLSPAGPVPPKLSGIVPSTISSQSQSAPPPGPGPSRDSLILYQTWPTPTDYVASGLMGDTNAITVDDCANGGRGTDTNPAAVDHSLHITYTPVPGGQRWAGTYWQRPANNWGDQPGGLDLRGLTALTFYARGEHGGEKLTFFTGGITGPYGDTLAKRSIKVTLTTSWQRFGIDLRGPNLGRVVGPFGWSASQADNPSGASFYLDDIVLDQAAITSSPTSTGTGSGSPTTLTPHTAGPTAPARRTCVDPPPGASPGAIYIMDGITLCPDRSPVHKYELGVDTSHQRRDWLSQASDALKMAYPPGQTWGAVFLTVGDPIPPGSRPGQDLSHCTTLQVDLRTDTAGAGLSIGMKDKDQPDNGTETKIRVTPTKTWTTNTFHLTNFTGTQLSAIYVVIEFVFEPNDPPQTVYFRNVRLLCP